jgi:hypothetical protein
MSVQRLFCLVLALSACGGDDDGGGDGDGASADAAAGSADAALNDAAPSEFAAHIVERTCAPNDGPAVTFSLGGAYDPDTCALDIDSRNIVISIYLDEFDVSAPHTYRFDAEDLRGAGTICPGGEGVCLQASAGEVRVETWDEGEGATGTWQLTIGDASESGSFDADWCAGQGGPYCG